MSWCTAWHALPAGHSRATPRRARGRRLGGRTAGAQGNLALLSHGWFAALALAYFRFQDLPKQLEGIPLEYFGEALAWMKQRPEIDPGRLAVLGTSRKAVELSTPASWAPCIRLSML